MIDCGSDSSILILFFPVRKVQTLARIKNKDFVQLV